MGSQTLEEYQYNKANTSCVSQYFEEYQYNKENASCVSQYFEEYQHNKENALCVKPIHRILEKNVVCVWGGQDIVQVDAHP